MKYDFTTIMDRRGKDAIAVDLPGKGGGFAPGGPKEGFDLIRIFWTVRRLFRCDYQLAESAEWG